MGVSIATGLAGAERQRNYIYLDHDLDLPKIIDKATMKTGSIAESIETGNKWILDSQYEWQVYIGDDVPKPIPGPGIPDVPDDPAGQMWCRTSPQGPNSGDPTWEKLPEFIDKTFTGDLADLVTLDKSNLVAAINEAAQTGGGQTQAVETDGITITGTGLASNPLKVKADYLLNVEHDTTLEGDGTAANPLKVVSASGGVVADQLTIKGAGTTASPLYATGKPKYTEYDITITHRTANPVTTTSTGQLKFNTNTVSYMEFDYQAGAGKPWVTYNFFDGKFGATIAQGDMVMIDIGNGDKLAVPEWFTVTAGSTIKVRVPEKYSDIITFYPNPGTIILNDAQFKYPVLPWAHASGTGSQAYADGVSITGAGTQADPFKASGAEAYDEYTIQVPSITNNPGLGEVVVAPSYLKIAGDAPYFEMMVISTSYQAMPTKYNHCRGVFGAIGFQPAMARDVLDSANNLAILPTAWEGGHSVTIQVPIWVRPYVEFVQSQLTFIRQYAQFPITNWAHLNATEDIPAGSDLGFYVRSADTVDERSWMPLDLADNDSIKGDGVNIPLYATGKIHYDGYNLEATSFNGSVTTVDRSLRIAFNAYAEFDGYWSGEPQRRLKYIYSNGRLHCSAAANTYWDFAQVSSDEILFYPHVGEAGMFTVYIPAQYETVLRPEPASRQFADQRPVFDLLPQNYIMPNDGGHPYELNTTYDYYGGKLVSNGSWFDYVDGNTPNDGRRASVHIDSTGFETILITQSSFDLNMILRDLPRYLNHNIWIKCDSSAATFTHPVYINHFDGPGALIIGDANYGMKFPSLHIQGNSASIAIVNAAVDSEGDIGINLVDNAKLIALRDITLTAANTKVGTPIGMELTNSKIFVSGTFSIDATATAIRCLNNSTITAENGFTTTAGRNPNHYAYYIDNTSQITNLSMKHPAFDTNMYRSNAGSKTQGAIVSTNGDLQISAKSVREANTLLREVLNKFVTGFVQLTITCADHTVAQDDLVITDFNGTGHLMIAVENDTVDGYTIPQIGVRHCTCKVTISTSYTKSAHVAIENCRDVSIESPDRNLLTITGSMTDGIHITDSNVRITEGVSISGQSNSAITATGFSRLLANGVAGSGNKWGFLSDDGAIIHCNDAANPITATTDKYHVTNAGLIINGGQILS